MATEKKNLTKAERREAAREKARKLREAEERQAKRTKIITIVSIIAAIAIVGVAIWAIVSNSSGESDGGYLEYDAPSVTVEPIENADAGIVDGYAVLGSDATLEDGAPTIDVYFDYMCVHCNTLEQTRGGEINKIVDEGRAKVVLHPVNIINSQYARDAAAAFHYVAENSPEHLLKFHENLFSQSNQVFSGQSSTEPGWDQIVESADDAGVPQEVIDAMQDGLDFDWVTGATEAFRQNFTGTPTVLLNGEDDNGMWSREGFLPMVGLEPVGEPAN